MLKKFDQLDVLIIGDVILDEYVECEPLGMSQEDPTIVVSPIDKKIFWGELELWLLILLVLVGR